MKPEEFVKMLKPYAKIIDEVFGIPWRAIIAQAALETEWLRKPTADLYTGRNSFNLFNIKGEGPAGSVKAYDHEYIRGRSVRVLHEFRAYHNYEESIEDYARLIAESKRYEPALQVASDPEEYVRKLQQSGYAQDPSYADKLIQIMRKYIKDDEDESEIID